MNPNNWIIARTFQEYPMATTIPQTTLQNVMADDAVAETLTLVAAMVGLPRETVEKIAEAGLPMIASVADDNPYAFKAMFAQSRKALPAPTPEFYRKLGKDLQAQQMIAANFKAICGSTTDALNREVARQAGATTEQAGKVLAAAMPAMVKALGKENTRMNEMGFGRQLRYLTA
jgi:hypothetical protein